MSPVHSRHPRRIPTSRAYWELKAEQVMNRVFAVEPSIELEIVEGAKVTAPPAAPVPMGHAPGVARRGGSSSWLDSQMLLASLPLMAALLASMTAAAFGFLSQQQQALQQERNLLLIERLRTLTPASATAPGNSGTGPDLPPPPTT